MARVNVEERAMDADAHKFRRMGHRLGVSVYDVYGRWLFVWRLSQRKRSATLSADEIDGAADREGFAAAAVAADLARETPEGVYLCGMTERLESLKSYDDRAERGRAKRWETGSEPHNDLFAAIAPVIAPAVAPVSSPLVLKSLSSSSKKTSGDRAAKTTPETRRFTDAFTALYREAARTEIGPTWGGKQGKQIKQLLARADVAEVIARAERLFRDPAFAWMRAGGVPDLGTLVAHFDRLAAGSAGGDDDGYRPPEADGLKRVRSVVP